MEDQMKQPAKQALINDTVSTSAKSALLAAGSVLGALIASSCCVVPLLLVTLGIGGTWVGNLTDLEPYKFFFLGLTALLLAAGFWHVYFKQQPVCADDAYCARPSSRRLTKIALWMATLLALASATVDLWATVFY